MAGQGRRTKDDPLRPLTARELKFVHAYHHDPNEQRALAAAGLRPASTGLLKRPAVALALEQRRQEQFAKADLHADRVLEELRRVAFFDPAAVFTNELTVKTLDEIPPAARACIIGLERLERPVVLKSPDGQWFVHNQIQLKVRLADKVKALDLLCQHFALLSDRSSVFIVGESDLLDRLDAGRKRNALRKALAAAPDSPPADLDPGAGLEPPAARRRIEHLEHLEPPASLEPAPGRLDHHLDPHLDPALPAPAVPLASPPGEMGKLLPDLEPPPDESADQDDGDLL